MKLFILAGELSGDKLGASLVAALKSLVPNCEFQGVAGPMMQAEGIESLFPMTELSVMGISEVLPKYLHLKRRLNETAEAVLAFQPDALITIDSPDFSLRLAKLVKAKSNVKTIHYVAPSVWAWRSGRAAKMAAHVDHVLALLPFEPPYMTAAGMGCDFVGHPIVSEKQATDDEIAWFRNSTGIGDSPILLALPGSRQSEIRRLLPIFEETITRVHGKANDLKVVVPAASSVAELVSQTVARWSEPPLVIDPTSDQDYKKSKMAAFASANVALAASGTVSLELAATNTPTVVAYDMSWLSWQIMSRMALIDTVTLVNIISETKAVPEFLGPACKAPDVAEAVCNLLTNPDARSRQIDAMELSMERLGRGGEQPGLRAARAVLRVVEAQ